MKSRPGILLLCAVLHVNCLEYKLNNSFDLKSPKGLFTYIFLLATSPSQTENDSGTWTYLGGSLSAHYWSGRSSIAKHNGSLYAAIGGQDVGLTSGSFHVRSWNGSWSVSSSYAADVWEPQIASDGSNLGVSFQSRTGPFVGWGQYSTGLSPIQNGSAYAGSHSGITHTYDNSGQLWMLFTSSGSPGQSRVTRSTNLSLNHQYTVNVDPAYSANSQVIAHDPITDSIYIAFSQSTASGDRDLYVLKYNSGSDSFNVVGGGPVTTMFGSHASDASSGNSMAFANGKVYIAFTEGNSAVIAFGDVYVSYHDISTTGGAWVKIASPANTGGAMASGGRGAGWANIGFTAKQSLVLTMAESSAIPANVQGRGLDTLVSKRWNGSSWVSRGGDFNDDGVALTHAYGFVQLVMIGDTMYRYYNYCNNDFPSESCGPAQSFVQEYKQ